MLIDTIDSNFIQYIWQSNFLQVVNFSILLYLLRKEGIFLDNIFTKTQIKGLHFVMLQLRYVKKEIMREYVLIFLLQLTNRGYQILSIHTLKVKKYL